MIAQPYPDPDRKPVTILTGFLGAGKTTLLNRILTERHGRRYAVIVNEFGAQGIDGDLVIDADEEIFELNNGCICCTVRGDLLRIVGTLLEMPDRFDEILIETTGLADPAPVLQTFLMPGKVHSRTRVRGVVTVVDARFAAQQIRQNAEARRQIAFADLLVVNKTDLVSEPEIEETRSRVIAINPMAAMRTASYCDLPLDALREHEGFDLGRVLELDPDLLSRDHHHHHADVQAVCIETGELLESRSLFAWLRELLARRGPDILRMKGIVSLADRPERYVLNAVHMVFQAEPLTTPAARAPVKSQLVFIGRGLGPELDAGLRECVSRKAAS